MDSEIQKQDGAQDAGRSSLHEMLGDLKIRYDALVEREKQHRSDINSMRRDLTKIAHERKAAYRAWQAESKRLVG